MKNKHVFLCFFLNLQINVFNIYDKKQHNWKVARETKYSLIGLDCRRENEGKIGKRREGKGVYKEGKK